MVDPLLPPGVVVGGVPARAFALVPGWDVVVDGEPEGRLRSREEAARDLLAAVELWWAEAAVGHVVLHAGVVSWRGAALVLPGRSHAGKSTLVAALLERGCGYLSDEYAVLRPDGLVLPYARDLSLREGRPGRGRRVPVTALVEQRPLPVGLVAVLRFTGTWAVEPLAGAPLVLALLDNAVAARSRTDECLTACGAVAAHARGVAGTRDEAGDAAERVLELLG